ncbi:TonB-dependent receptor [Sphingomonas bisphenolicum]|uniref:TonB-dependent receptor n=1 Tax=Sphingomonas bisphenolicum TaxID=296544 RepID=A0ABM7GAC0_9SPHN|nr:TonB-dependent receptor [Sphingomonas bisphenolicum]BBF72050.1 TonB-dependent receptor [Sphingomonas bisphenolicum]
MKLFLSVSALAMTASGGSMTAYAADEVQQSAAASASTDTAPGSADIIVTAQNRQQSVQDVPIAISVISGDQLAAAGVTDVASVEKISPSLQITSDTTATRVTVRGVGTLSNGESQDQSIAVNIDGEYINRPTILNAATFDMERVEVLRGPQGTLYGRNSTGGAVNFITRKPGKDFGVNASATYGNYNQVIAQGGVDVPLGDIGAIRVAGIYSDRDGYNKHNNTFLDLPQFTARTGNRSGDDHTWGARATLRLTPTDGLTIDATYEHAEQKIIPASQAYANMNLPGNAPGANCELNGYVEVGPTTPGVQCIPQNTSFLAKINRNTYDAPLTGLGIFNLQSDAIRGRLAYEFGPATLTYTGGYRTTHTDGQLGLGPAYVSKNWGSGVKTHSHELRLNGDAGGIQWQTGIFYFNEKQETDTGLYNPFIGANGSYINYFRRPTTSESWSAFGQVEVPLTETLTAVGGLRYTKDKRHAVFNNYGFRFNSGLVEITAPAASPLNLRYKGDRFNYLVGLNYKPNADTLIYGKMSTGYKAGGFDAVGTFKPETNTAYEGGMKLNFGPGSRHQFNIAGFYYDYKDLQNDVLLDAALGAQTFNSGKATIYGVEAEAVIQLSDNDRFNATFNYLYAKYDEFIASYAVLNPANPNQTSLLIADNPDLAGNRLAQTPKFVIGVGYEHIFDMGSAGTITANAFSRFKSDYFTSFFNYNDSRQTAYTQSDLSLEYKPENGKFGVQAFVRNLENERPLAFASYIAAGPDDIYNFQFGAPRTYGVRVSVNF